MAEGCSGRLSTGKKGGPSFIFCMLSAWVLYRGLAPGTTRSCLCIRPCTSTGWRWSAALSTRRAGGPRPTPTLSSNPHAPRVGVCVCFFVNINELARSSLHAPYRSFSLIVFKRKLFSSQALCALARSHARTLCLLARLSLSHQNLVFSCVFACPGGSSLPRRATTPTPCCASPTCTSKV